MSRDSCRAISFRAPCERGADSDDARRQGGPGRTPRSLPGRPRSGDDAPARARGTGGGCCDGRRVGPWFRSRDRNFFELGGTSLGIVRLAARLRDDHGYDVRCANFSLIRPSPRSRIESSPAVSRRIRSRP
ncbi:hypothetical protein GS421_03450 [Rhodococcus hoagii]|nr:hypothetical protein [Prescottella equi]